MGSRREILSRWRARLLVIEERLRESPGAAFRGCRLIRRKILAYLTAHYEREPQKETLTRGLVWPEGPEQAPERTFLRPTRGKPPRSTSEVRASLLRIQQILSPDDSSSWLRPI